MEKSASRVLMTIILCMMMLDTHWALLNCYKYPRYFASSNHENFILSMDMHFSSDLLVYVGYSRDQILNRNIFDQGYDIPVVAAMSIADPTFKWTLSAVQWVGQFGDVDISNDGTKSVVSGSYWISKDLVILWVLNSADGSIISQKIVKVLNSGNASPLTWISFKQILIVSSQPVVYLLMRTDSQSTSIYLAKIDYTPTSVSPLWFLQTDTAQATQSFSQITFGGSSSTTLETSLYVVVPVGNKYKVSRIAEDGGIQWTYEFPLDTTLQTEVFIEYALNAVSGGQNTLVIANAQYKIAVMKVSQTESVAAVGPVLSSLKLYQELQYFGIISAIYVKPSSDQIYLLKKWGSICYIGYFSTTGFTISYQQAFYQSQYGNDLHYPRGMFKDETNYFAAFNIDDLFGFDY